MPHPSSSQPGADGSQRALNFFILFVESMAFVTIVFLRRRFGDKYINLQAGVALLIILFFGAFFPGYDLRPLLVYLGAFVLMCVRHNLGKRLGLGEHSRYSGAPRLCRLFRRSNESAIKRRHEPAFVLLLGYLASLFNDPLAMLLCCSGGAILFNECSVELAVKRRLTEMNDLYLEQQSVLARFRHERGGGGHGGGGGAYLD